ncbi:MAG: hypothetical protein U0326_14980 [Polyangiales bacterium]
MSDLSPEARALLDAAARADEPTSADQERIARALAIPLGIAALAPATAQASAVTVAASGAAVSLKVAAVVAAVALGVGAVGVTTLKRNVRSHASTPRVERVARTHAAPVAAPARVAPAPARVALAPAVIAPVAAPPVVAAPAAVVEAPARVHASHGARGVDTLAAESELLGAAHRAVNGGDASHALALLRSYGDRFPHGVLREERDVEVVFVLCRLGRRDEARAAAERFLRAHRHSPLAHRVETSCAGLSSDDHRVDAPTRR